MLVPKKLKRCPFCGGQAELRVYSAELQFVQCTSCLGSTSAFPNGDEAIAAWNNRWTMLRKLRKVVRECLKNWLKD